MERSVDEHFYSTAPNKQLASQIRQKTLRFYGDMVRERDGGECFWASGFFVAKIRKV
jgi:hypothetical protein